MRKSITLVSLNLWRFYDWENRFPSIIKLLKEINPDIIFTQETQLDPAIDQGNQIKIINSELDFPHTNFTVADIKTVRKGVPLKYPVYHGLGIISRFPFETEIIPLTKAGDDKEKRIVLKCDMDIDGKIHTLSNLHFSNSDKWSEDHFRETISIFKERNIKSLLAGDFNISNISKFKDLYAKDYISSSDFCDYISYPNDNVSYDYVLLPEKYEFEEFHCKEENVSDHKMIVAKIKLP